KRRKSSYSQTNYIKEGFYFSFSLLKYLAAPRSCCSIALCFQLDTEIQAPGYKWADWAFAQGAKFQGALNYRPRYRICSKYFYVFFSNSTCKCGNLKKCLTKRKTPVVKSSSDTRQSARV